MAERNTGSSDTGAEAALAVAEVGLASRRAAKQAWLQAVAALGAPQSDAAQGSWADSARADT